ncbi:MAG: hypothetical protein VX223_04890 [Myxococcota bacterium]|nr:hypothetical protein [Myxococcota bacterium]
MQRTLFPAIPNTAETHWLGTVQALYQELERHGGSHPFKLFRGWMRDRNIYVKEEAEALLDFLDCDAKPAVAIRHFGAMYLGCDTPQAQKVAMFRWLMGWNPLLVKSVFEALDVDAGGRLHSTHELYRMITSYAFAGEHITLPSFQAWIKWMAATEHIRYIGIRWGLGDLGKNALSTIKHIDVDEVLEEEEEAREAGTPEVHPMLVGASPSPLAMTPPSISADAEPPLGAYPDGEAPVDDTDIADAEDLPDMPSEPPVPTAETVKSVMGASVESAMQAASAPTKRAQPKEASISPAVGGASAAWFAAGPKPADSSALELGFDAKQYGADPALFSFRMACAARLHASGLPRDVWHALFISLDSDGVFERYFAQKRPWEEILAGMRWLQGTSHRAALSWVLLDFMQLRKALEDRPGYADQLEQKAPAEALYSVHGALFDGATDGAAFWYAREMVRLELWEG